MSTFLSDIATVEVGVDESCYGCFRCRVIFDVVMGGRDWSRVLQGDGDRTKLEVGILEVRLASRLHN